MRSTAMQVSEEQILDLLQTMVRYLAELCGLDLPDMQEAVYNFEVIHEINL